ncbi:DUF6930 domain-containing protein [Capilliphycus salinus ALCB114379]|uniref:DUF6930 domain-containing protein n=1 Tax=Capilliphycus salinus TaxID=2768948 RepID=UPI0039A51AF8
MARLNRSTLRRLQSLPQIPSVWEGDRRSVSPESSSKLEGEDSASSECIIWVDGSQGMVRAMDMVASDLGPEATVRTLLRAIEHPQSPTPAARPQKIVVKDREIQFFLRGVLQDLDITIEYVPDLPLIDEIFRGLQEVAENRPPQLPPQYASALQEKAYAIWEDAPWEKLGEHQILSIELNEFDVNTLYISTLGKLGMDYGVLMYRSLDSLKQFRERVVQHNPALNLEEAFLTQDCLFVTYESNSDFEDEDDVHLGAKPISEIEPSFGNLHPLEGLRSILYEEEAATVLVALEALHRFLRDERQKFKPHKFPALSRRYRIRFPQPDAEKKQIMVTVATLPEVATELLEMAATAENEDEDDLDVEETQVLLEGLVPPKSLLSLGVMPWDTAEYLRNHIKFYQDAEVDIPEDGDGLPVILIQTSKPKAQTLIQSIQEAGGLTGICFNPGEDPIAGCNYDLGILRTEDGDLHLLGEFLEDDPTHQEARQKWDARCQKTQGWCGLIIAMGLTGASRGQPGLKDMMALLEVRSLSPEELGLEPLQLVPTSF